MDFCGKAQFQHSFGQIAQNYAEAVPFHKISTPGNYVKLRYFHSDYLPVTFSSLIQTTDTIAFIISTP